jgi:hypothetical protein
MIIRFQIVFIIPFLLASLISCTTVNSKINEGSGPKLWVANASLVDFDDLYEIHEEVSSPVDKKVARYEGFYDQYKEGTYEIPRNLQYGVCLSPEAEWMIYFPPKTQDKIKLLMADVNNTPNPQLFAEYLK